MLIFLKYILFYRLNIKVIYLIDFLLSNNVLKLNNKFDKNLETKKINLIYSNY